LYKKTPSPEPLLDAASDARVARYFFSMVARNATVPFHASAASVSRSRLVVGIVECVAGVIANLERDLLVELPHRRFEFVHVVGGDAVILSGERSEDRCIDFS